MGLVVKNLPVNAGDIIRDACSIPGSGTSPGEGNGNPLQYCCLKNPMDRGAKQAIVLRSLKWLWTHLLLDKMELILLLKLSNFSEVLFLKTTTTITISLVKQEPLLLLAPLLLWVFLTWLPCANFCGWHFTYFYLLVPMMILQGRSYFPLYTRGS